jgi:hypothetical protein
MPLIAALISAFVILVGYFYERFKQREFEIFQTQQVIYTRLIDNLVLVDLRYTSCKSRNAGDNAKRLL